MSRRGVVACCASLAVHGGLLALPIGAPPHAVPPRAPLALLTPSAERKPVAEAEAVTEAAAPEPKARAPELRRAAPKAAVGPVAEPAPKPSAEPGAQDTESPAPATLAARPEEPAAPPPKPSAGPKLDVEAFATDLRRRVQAEQRYPRLARRTRTEGTVELTVRVAQGGALDSVEITRSSGADVLDEEAIRMVQAAAPFAGAESAVEVRVPVVFRLR